MKSSLVKNLSANTIQLVLNQVFGFGIFYVLSAGLDKSSFGQLNLVLAILLVSFNILSFGIDQLIIKKVAAGENTTQMLSLYLLHVLFTGFIFYGILFAGQYFFQFSNYTYSLLLLIGAGKLMIFFSTPFKQVANGLERFRLLAFMSVGSNLVRCLGLAAIYLLHDLTLHNTVVIFIAGDVIELACCVLLFRATTNTGIKLKWNRTTYLDLLRESLPQTGVVLITSALARFDWIFIGFMTSAVKLAEYSFAYKIFEIATLPLLAIAPLLIPRFTRLFQQQDIKVNDLNLLIRAEMIIAALTALVLNIGWNPVIDTITSGKYGLVNETTIFLLSLCMPFLYLNNFLWTIFFAQGCLKAILYSFIISLLVNVVLDLLLIPFFANEGAAFAFLLSCVAQAVYYSRNNLVPGLNRTWKPLMVCALSALVSGALVKFIFATYWIALPVSILLYILSLLIAGQLKLSDRYTLRAILK